MAKKKVYKDTFTVRPQPDNLDFIMGEIEREKKELNSPSVSNTVETILLKYFRTLKNK